MVRLLCLIAIVLCSALGAVESPYLVLKGYLGKDELASARLELEKLRSAQAPEVLLEINSVSGDLSATLDFATLLYQLKQEHPLKVIAYIDENAVGPAAILPFLSDELYTSFYVSWGDIPYNSEGALPTNILRNRVVSLISAQRAQAALLQLMAAAMVDAKLTLVDQQGWKVAGDKIDPSAKVISGHGETLVVNHNQLQELGLVNGMMNVEAFRQRFQQVAATPKGATAGDHPVAEPKTELEKRLAAHIHYNPKGPNTVGHIIIDDRTTGITPATWLYVKAALDSYKKSKPSFILLELNTPGGQVYPAQEISDALKEMDTQYDIPVVAYINNWAMSAGAMIAYSCRFIAVVKDGSMGAAEPVLQGAEGQMIAASEKINSAIRTDFASRANFFGRNPLLAEGMVDKDPILVMRHGRIIKLLKEEEVTSRDVVIKPKGKLLTLDADQLMTYGVADILVTPVKLAPITDTEKETGSWPANKVALFKQPFFDQISDATVHSFQGDWRLRFLAFLAHPMVSSALLMGLMIGGYLEMSSPGAALPGSVALICLLLLVLTSYSQEAAGFLDLILVLGGLALIGIEVFLVPTWGLLGLAGILCFVVGLIALMLPGIDRVSFDFDTHSFNAAGEVFLERLAWLCGTIVLSLLIIAALWRFVMPNFTPFKRLVLTGEQDASLGFFAGPDPSTLPPPGSRGVALATLRPSGKVMIADQLYDAVTAGDFIEEGEPIIVARLDGGKIIVAKESRGIKT